MPLKASSMLSSLWTTLIEYETPRLVRIHNQKLGVVRRLIQASIITYVGFYALWMQRGYQEFCQVESSVTVKIKGTTKSHLHPDSPNDPSEQRCFFWGSWLAGEMPVLPPWFQVCTPESGMWPTTWCLQQKMEPSLWPPMSSSPQIRSGVSVHLQWII